MFCIDAAVRLAGDAPTDFGATPQVSEALRRSIGGGQAAEASAREMV
jgi:hypothetical protein